MRPTTRQRLIGKEVLDEEGKLCRIISRKKHAYTVEYADGTPSKELWSFELKETTPVSRVTIVPLESVFVPNSKGVAK